MTQAAPSPRSVDTRRRRRVKALQRPGGGTESRRRRVPAVLPRSVDTRRRRRVKALQRPCDIGAESRRRRVPVVLPRSADTRRRLRLKALQRPGDIGAESRRRRVPAVLTQAAPSQVGTAVITFGRRVQAVAPSLPWHPRVLMILISLQTRILTTPVSHCPALCFHPRSPSIRT